MLLSSEGSKVQGWVVEGGDDDEVGLGARLTWAMVAESSGVDCVLELRSTWNVREVHEEDFVLDSGDTKEE